MRRALRYLLLVILPPDKIARRMFPRTTPPTSVDGPSGSRGTHHLDTSNGLHVHHVSSCEKRTSYLSHLRLLLTVWVGRVTINTLPDDVLLLIFYFYRATYLDRLGDVHRLLRLSWRWHRLVHVCRKWRSVGFGSPNFLDLRLVCGPSTHVELTTIWPPLPIIITDMSDWSMREDYDFDAAIVCPNRVCEINLLYLTSSLLQRLASAMQGQFPALVHLSLGFYDHGRPRPALPDAFLGGSAPQLQSLELNSIAFPALPKFLLSATDLVDLTLWDIPPSGYIPPEAIVTGLAVLANLKSLVIGFESPLSLPDRESQYPLAPTRTALPALTRFEFKGVSKYLEGVVARIDAPLLDSIWITFFHQLIFDIPQLAQFIRRTTRFQAFNEAHVTFGDFDVQVESLPPTRAFDEKSGLGISCTELDWQLSSLTQVFPSFFPSICMVERLYIYRAYRRRTLPSQWQDDVENMQWLEFFHPFTAVKNFYVCKEFVQCIAHALQELVGERVTDVLLSLEKLFLDDPRPLGPVEEAIGQFVAARQFLGHPVTVSHWKREAL